MDPNNSEFIVEELNESDFSDVSSSIGMDPKEMVEKIRKLENMVKKNSKDSNNVDQSGMMQMSLQIGKEIGELKNKIDGISDELKGIKGENKELKAEKGYEIEGIKKENAEGIAKLMKALEEFKQENAEKVHDVEEMKKAFQGLKTAKQEENGKNDELKEENGKLKEEMAKLKEEMQKEMAKLKAQIKGKNSGLEGKNFENSEELKAAFDGLKAEIAEMCQEMEGKKSIEGIKESKQNENRAFEELKKENGRKLREMAELITQIGGKNAELEGKIVENNEELKAAFNGFKNEIGVKNVELDGQIAELKEENKELNVKVEKLIEANNKFKMENSNEMSFSMFWTFWAFWWFGLFWMAMRTEQIGEIEWVKYDWKAFKLDSSHCGPQLTISEGGFDAKHSGPNGINTVLANLPIPSFNSSANNKSAVAFYFEVQILQQTNIGYNIGIGFCTQQFPLEDNWFGNWNNSIGIYRKGGMWIDGTLTKFGNADGCFKEGNFVGIGIIHKPNSKMECFTTWNGHLLGKAALPSKFANIQLFPAINLRNVGNSIRVNFDKENCQFKEFERVLQ